MLFHFVDRICEIEKGKFIRGLKNVTRNEGFFYWLPNGKRVLSPAVVTEALCQLGGWLKIVTTDFMKRPVLLADEHTEYLDTATAGDQIELEVEVVEMNDDIVITKGTARVDGKPILIGHHCRGYLLPLEEFDDPERVKIQYNNLYKPHLSVQNIKSKAPLKPIAGASTFESLRYIDGIVEFTSGKSIKSYKNVASCEPYFSSHFPRKPCVPGVILLTFLGESCQYLVRSKIDTPLREKALIPTFIKNVRFRKFVEPGDVCLLECNVIDGDVSLDNENILVRTTIFSNNNRVMQAEMGFKTMFSKKSCEESHEKRT